MCSPADMKLVRHSAVIRCQMIVVICLMVFGSQHISGDDQFVTNAQRSHGLSIDWGSLGVS